MAEPGYLVSETNGEAQIMITRFGDTNVAAAVGYHTFNGESYYSSQPAVPGEDFVPQATIAEFAPGEVSRTISIPLIDDAMMEWNRPFNVMIDAAPTALIGTRSQTRVVIVDDDSLGKPGSVDPTFQSLEPTLPWRIAVRRFALEKDGQIIAAVENESSYSGEVRLRRVRPDGTSAPDFDVAVRGPYGPYVEKLAIDSQGRIILPGNFTSIAGISPAAQSSVLNQERLLKLSKMKPASR